jgi:flagellar hook-basal body complex protein FliE
MIESANSASSIAAMLKTLQTHSSQAAGQGFDLPGVAPTPKTDFSDLIRQAVNQTNAAQVDSQNTAMAFERGEGVPLTDVVLKMQKASLSFEATLQVRNKVLKAYEDIMNMPV